MYALNYICRTFCVRNRNAFAHTAPSYSLPALICNEHVNILHRIYIEYTLNLHGFYIVFT